MASSRARSGDRLFGRLVLLPLLLVGIASGCDRATRVDAYTVSGPWVGTVRTISFSFTLREFGDGTVVGSGNTVVQGRAAALEVTGIHSPPSVSLIISNPSFEPFNFRGGFASADTLHGELYGSGFNAERIVFTRER